MIENPCAAIKPRTLPTYDVILDFDDVIYPLCHGIKDVLTLEGMIEPGYQITRWDIHEDFDMDKESFWALLDKPGNQHYLYTQPLEGQVIRSLHDLQRAGHRLHLVTARESDLVKRYTWEIIRRDGLPFESVTFTKDKGPMVTELNASFSVDDGPHNYEALDQRNHLAFLMDAPHNRDFFTEKRVVSFKQFADIVLGFQQAGVQVRGDSK